MTPRSLTRSEQDSVETLRDRLLPGWACGRRNRQTQAVSGLT